jgi:hypothetical protein
MCDNLVLEHTPYVKLLNFSENKLNIFVYLKLICIFTPYLSRPEHARFWYLIYVLQIVPNYISFLQFDDK